jgi:hypothetical protein
MHVLSKRCNFVWGRLFGRFARLLCQKDYMANQQVFDCNQIYTISEPPNFKERKTVQEMMEQPTSEKYDIDNYDITFNSAMCAISILSFMINYVSELPVSLVTRMLDTHGMM